MPATSADAGLREQFLELILADQGFVDAEFASLIAANTLGPPRPAGAAPVAGGQLPLITQPQLLPRRQAETLEEEARSGQRGPPTQTS